MSEPAKSAAEMADLSDMERDELVDEVTDLRARLDEVTRERDEARGDNAIEAMARSVCVSSYEAELANRILAARKAGE